MRSAILVLGVAMFTIPGLELAGQQNEEAAGEAPPDVQEAENQTGPRDLSSAGWCLDATTYCWDASRSLAGLRLVFEPQLGVLFQSGNDKFEDANFRSLEKIGLETNLIEGLIGLQGMLIYPSTLKFQQDSPLLEKGFIKDEENGQVRVEVGFSFGVTFLDGILAVGYGWVNYDERDFINVDQITSTTSDSPFLDGFFYFNVQPIAAIKSALKGS